MKKSRWISLLTVFSSFWAFADVQYKLFSMRSPEKLEAVIEQD